MRGFQFGTTDERRSESRRKKICDGGIQLTTVTSSIGASRNRSRRAESTWSPWTAMCKGVKPFFVFDVTQASLPKRRSTTCSCPLLAAQCRGVNPSWRMKMHRMHAVYFDARFHLSFRTFFIQTVSYHGCSIF